MTLSPGERAGPYEVISLLAAGGMGEVYRARDPRLRREVAVKVVKDTGWRDPMRLQRFEQEARAAGALNHPNLLTVYDVGDHQGSPYIVFELLEGETLRDRLNQGPLSPRPALACAVQLATALAAAHDKGIVHRDLKPENVFLTTDGGVKILDFGLAKLRATEHPDAAAREEETTTQGTQPGTVMGTVGYMAPELVRGLPADARTDLFSLGAILYEMLGGRRAFQKETAAETMTAILWDDPPPLSTARPDITPTLQNIIERCLEKQPQARFQSARDLAFALQSLATTAGQNLDVRGPAQDERGRRRRGLWPGAAA